MITELAIPPYLMRLHFKQNFLKSCVVLYASVLPHNSFLHFTLSRVLTYSLYQLSGNEWKER
jgi:hypothetical protein